MFGDTKIIAAGSEANNRAASIRCTCLDERGHLMLILATLLVSLCGAEGEQEGQKSKSYI